MKIIAVKESIFSNNDKVADELRASLRKKGAFMINVMSSPGSGKTTLLTRLINDMKSKIRIVAMDVDIETDVDARRIAENTGVDSVQIHNGGLCHIDAQMVTDALEQADFPETDLIVLENIGNLVCPAEFDTGAHLNMMLLSVPEGDDKPLKYPLMFEKCDVVVVTKIDTLEAFDFDMKKFEERGVGKRTVRKDKASEKINIHKKGRQLQTRCRPCFISLSVLIKCGFSF